jgi:hypothetical protein
MTIIWCWRALRLASSRFGVLSSMSDSAASAVGLVSARPLVTMPALEGMDATLRFTAEDGSCRMRALAMVVLFTELGAFAPPAVRTTAEAFPCTESCPPRVEAGRASAPGTSSVLTDAEEGELEGSCGSKRLMLGERPRLPWDGAPPAAAEAPAEAEAGRSSTGEAGADIPWARL